MSFNEGSHLGKYIFNENHAKLYITQDGSDYAIAYSDGQSEMPINFKATENGSYTLTINPGSIEMDYLHLIDNMTGADVDLLAAPSYTFNARTTDYTSRFRLVFSANENDNENENFAFISNDEIIINGEGTVQMIDALGRILFTQEYSPLNAHLSTLTIKPGMYVLQLITSTETKTQKIIVK